jgi:hypothetical protein
VVLHDMTSNSPTASDASGLGQRCISNLQNEARS